MNVIDSRLHPATARVDGDGRLIAADPRILDLVSRAGGGLGAGVPQPPIAAMVRLSTRLGIAIARTVTVADNEDDLELQVRADPDASGVTLQISGWALRSAWRGLGSEGERGGELAVSAGGWRWEADAALCVTHVAPDAALRFGVDLRATLGAPLQQLFLGVEDGALPTPGEITAQMRFPTQQVRLKGSDARFELSAKVRTDGQGRFAGLLGCAEPIAAPDEDEGGEFAAGFAAQLDRSLRRPLERIIANAGSMSAELDGPLSASYIGYAQDIAQAGRHLLGLVDDLVDLEAVERADFAIPPEPIDLADVARRAAGLLTVRAADGNVHIERPALTDSLPASGDFRRALQVLVNLMGNAVRYSPRGGTIRIRTGHDDAGRACVIVADEGKGVAPFDHERIFDKFGRVDPDEPGGSGLGLYISRRLARAMGGEIAIDSALGEGARFIFSLPAR